MCSSQFFIVVRKKNDHDEPIAISASRVKELSYAGLHLSHSQYFTANEV